MTTRYSWNDPEYPETLPVEEATWLTICPYRSPQKKAHITRGHAFSALSAQSGGVAKALYERVGDTWVLRWTGTHGRYSAPWKDACK